MNLRSLTAGRAVPPGRRTGYAMTGALAMSLLVAVWGTAHGETLTLADCLRETAAHNPTILAQQYAIEQATGSRLVFRARALPRATIGGVVGYLGGRNTETLRVPVRDADGKKQTVLVDSPRDATEVVIGTGEISQPIFDAAIPASWRRAEVGITVAQENFYTVTAAELNQTRTFFYQALFQQENGEVLRQIDAGFGSEVKSLDQLVTAGLVGRQGLLASQVQRTNFGTALLANVGSVQTGITSLLQNMGRDLGPVGTPGASPAAQVHLAGPLEDRALAFDAAAAAREALAHRPDFRTLRATVRQMNEDANIARGGFYPVIQVYVAGELVPNTFIQRTDTNSVRQSDQTQTSEVRPGVRGSWTILDTGAVRGTVRTLEAQRDVISVALRAGERNLPSDLALVRAQMVDASNRIAALRGNAGIAQDNLNTIQAGVAQGINSELEFLNAQTDLYVARAGLLTAELQMSLAYADFDRLTGRYLRYTNPVADAAPHDPARK